MCIPNWLLLCNAQSVFYKLDELRALVSAMKPLFICITESWLTPEISDELVGIRGYNLFRNDRRDDPSEVRRGGGTMVYCSSSLRPSIVHIPDHFFKPHGFECNLVNVIDLDSSPAFIFCLYIPPNLISDIFQSIKNYVINSLDYVLNLNPEAALYVCGDFNRYDMSFLCNQFNLCNIVSYPTFGNNVLDKFFCADHSVSNFSSKTGPPLGDATYARNTVFISKYGGSTNEKISPHKVYDLRQSNVTTFRERLANADWSLFSRIQDVEECVQYFYNILQSALSVIPVSYVFVTRNTKPWITPVIIELINKRWAAYKAKNCALFNHYKRKVKAEISKSKKIWCQKMCTSCKGAWSVVNNVRGKDEVRALY